MGRNSPDIGDGPLVFFMDGFRCCLSPRLSPLFSADAPTTFLCRPPVSSVPTAAWVELLQPVPTVAATLSPPTRRHPPNRVRSMPLLLLSVAVRSCGRCSLPLWLVGGRMRLPVELLLWLSLQSSLSVARSVSAES